MRETAKRAFVAVLVVGSVVVVALALWKLKLLISILFLAFIIAAAMRPAVEGLKARGVPRGVGIGLHYLGLVGAVGLLLYFVVPTAIDQIQEAVPTSEAELERETEEAEGIKEQVLLSIQRRPEDLPSA